MSDAPERQHHYGELTSAQLDAVDRLLAEALKVGPACKRRAISKILEKFPTFTRGECWQRIRYLRRRSNIHTPRESSATAAFELRQKHVHSLRRWSAVDDDKLLNWAGYEPVEKIANRLGRSERAVRFRLCALGMSGRVTDAWSLRELRKLLRISPERLRHLIGAGTLRVRDARITAESLSHFCRSKRDIEVPADGEDIAGEVRDHREAYGWEKAAVLLGVELSQVHSLVSSGELKLMDTFVTDRSFEEFCRRFGSEINLGLIDPRTAKWLIQEYGVTSPPIAQRIVPRAQKHALVVRTCKCGREIAGNVFFKHVRVCQGLSIQAASSPVQSVAGVSTYVPASRRYRSNDGYGPARLADCPGMCAN